MELNYCELILHYLLMFFYWVVRIPFLIVYYFYRAIVCIIRDICPCFAEDELDNQTCIMGCSNKCRYTI